MGLWNIASNQIYAQASDPGAVGAGSFWTDTDANITYRRLDDNSDWAVVGTSSVVSLTEYGYLDGVTSAIQTQLNAKQATLTAANISQQQPADPTGTASTTFVMCGTAMTFTPAKSGKIRIHVSFINTNNTVTDGVQVKVKYGTGTAPVNGAAETGSQLGKNQYSAVLNAAMYVNGHMTAYVSGLTLSTAYWFDLAQAAIVGGTAGVQFINCVIEELEV